MKTLTVLGSTGSIGTNTLDVVRRNRQQYQLYALAAGRNVDVLAEQIVEFHPKLAVMAKEDDLRRLLDKLIDLGHPRELWPILLAGSAAFVQVATAPEVNIVISAMVGIAGLEATYEAARLRKRVGLANKEVLVAGGKLLMEAVTQSGAELLPIDSEHNGPTSACVPAAGKRSRG